MWNDRGVTTGSGVHFAASDGPSLGVEWEFGLVDRHSRDLVNAAADLFDKVGERTGVPGGGPRLHKELLRNTVEVVTGVCGTVAEAMTDLRATLDPVHEAADDLGVDLFGAGTHPFGQWSQQQLTPGHRYEELISRTQWWGRQMLIWGVHVHVGLRHADHVMPVLSALLNQYPHLQALSASSPIWAGVDTGYASNRAMMFQQLPTAGLPFQFQTWAEFEGFVASQMKTGVIENIDEIRWDIRPAPRLGTLEMRVCDGVSNTRELGALVALTHCLVVDLEERLIAGETLPSLAPWDVQENKWRAARYGLDAWIITDADSNERLLMDDLADLLERLAPVAERLGCPDELAAVAEIPGRGASYQRQRKVAEDTGGDLVAVVDSVVRELDAGL
jgi:glutamate---cysteine ligase / carboxylate-amine ligase